MQVQPEVAASLDTDDVFILEHKTENLWVSRSYNFVSVLFDWNMFDQSLDA